MKLDPNIANSNLLFGALISWFLEGTVNIAYENVMKYGEALLHSNCLFIIRRIYTLGIGEKEKWIKGEDVGHRQTDSRRDGHLCEIDSFFP